MVKMILGTVQLGMPYGINNAVGQPNMREAMDILDYAYQNGVDTLDTASSYGDSEKVIGNYINQHNDKVFRVCTKLPVRMEKMNITDCCEESRQKLGVDKLYVYYLHRFEQCKNDNVLRQLLRLKESGQITNIGISIYQPDELQYIIENLSDVIDVVQIPFNVMDNNRWTQDELLGCANRKGIKLYARSIFLQGVILSNIDSEICQKMEITSQMTRLQDISKSLKRSVAQLAIDYVSSIEEIERWLIGCETVEQIKENIGLCKNARRLESNMCEEIKQISQSLSEKVIDPRKWKK